MNKVRFIFLLFVISGLINYACADKADRDEAGFNEICKIYTEVLNSNMSRDQASKYVFDNIANRVGSKDALDLHDVIFQVDPAKRYKIFKESVEGAIKKKWDCAAMKTLMK